MSSHSSKLKKKKEITYAIGNNILTQDDTIMTFDVHNGGIAVRVGGKVTNIEVTPEETQEFMNKMTDYWFKLLK